MDLMIFKKEDCKYTLTINDDAIDSHDIFTAFQLQCQMPYIHCIFSPFL